MDFSGSDIQLWNLMTEYPTNVNDISIPALSSKYEFVELESSLDDPPPGKGEFYKHQILIQRILLVMDRLLILHGTGTGKTYLIGLIGEVLRKMYLGDTAEAKSSGEKVISRPAVITSGKGIRRMLIVVSNDLQVENVKRMLICNSTGGRYLTDKLLKGRTEQGLKSIATKLVKDWYEITTYERLGKQLSEMESSARNIQEADEMLANRYRNYVIFLDEIHNRRINPNKDIFMSKNLKDKEQQYRQLWRLTHTPPDIKVIGSTANLAVNNVNEARPVMNIISDVDRQIPLNVDLNDISIERLSSMVPIISFLRSFNMGAMPVNRGEQMGSIPIALTYLPMSERQSTIYRQIVERRRLGNLNQVAEAEAERETQQALGEGGQDSIYGLVRYASNGIFPDNTVGNMSEGGFHKYFKRDSSGWYRAQPEMIPYLNDPSKIVELSTKRLFLAELAQSRIGQPGVMVVFAEQVTGNGIITAAKTLDYFGFENFQGGEIFLPNAGGYSYCKENVRINPNFRKKPRYVYIGKEGIRNTDIQSVLNLLTSPENIDGEYIKVVFISKVSSEAISIYHVTTFVQYQAAWTPTTEKQAKERIYRSQSHLALMQREIEKKIRNGMSLREARASTVIEVNEYYLASVYTSQAGATMNLNSIDANIYQLSLQKDRGILGLIRKLAQLSFDCPINRKRNIRPDDVDYSADCHYQKCEYDCYYSQNSRIDFSTYDVYYSMEASSQIQDGLINFFSNVSSGTVNTIRKYLDPFDEESAKYRPVTVEIALTRMILDRVSIPDRFGFPCYLAEDRGLYFLVRNYPLQTGDQNSIQMDRGAAYYGNNFIAQNATSFDTLVTEMFEIKSDSLINSLRTLDISTPLALERFQKTLSELSAENKARVLEDATVEFVEKGSTLYNETVSSALSNNFSAMHEPVSEIRRVQAGHNYNKDYDFTMGPDFIFDTSTEIVYVHIIYTRVVGQTKYHVGPSMKNIRGRIRIYKPSENRGWRDADEYERLVYQRIFQYLRYERLRVRRERFPYLGSLSEGDFLILNFTPTAGKNYLKSTGRNCMTWNRPILVDILWTYLPQMNGFVAQNNLMSVPPVSDDAEYSYVRPVDTSKYPPEVKAVENFVFPGQNYSNLQDVIALLERTGGAQHDKRSWFGQNGYSDITKIAYYYSWLRKGGPNKKIMCRLIREYMERNNLLEVY